MAPDREDQSENDTESLRAERGEASGATGRPAVEPNIGAMIRGPVADEVSGADRGAPASGSAEDRATAEERERRQPE